MESSIFFAFGTGLFQIWKVLEHLRVAYFIKRHNKKHNVTNNFHKRTLTAKSLKCQASVQICSPVTGHGDSRQITEKLLVRLQTIKQT
jgi:hypothetical protein